jgi:prophage regulatory protein
LSEIDGYVREPIARQISGVSKSTVKRWIAEGTFPAPIKRGKRLNLWSVAELRRYAADPLAYRAAPTRPATPGDAPRVR